MAGFNKQLFIIQVSLKRLITFGIWQPLYSKLPHRYISINVFVLDNARVTLCMHIDQTF